MPSAIVIADTSKSLPPAGVRIAWASVGGPVLHSPICNGSSIGNSSLGGGAGSASIAAAFNSSDAPAPTTGLVVTEAYAPPASLVLFVGISSIVSAVDGTPLALTSELAAAPWLAAALASVAAGNGGIFACAGAAASGATSQLRFATATLLLPVQTATAAALGVVGNRSSAPALVARFAVDVSLDVRVNESAAAGGWQEAEAVVCSLVAATLVVRAGTTGTDVAASSTSGLVQLGAPVSVRAWRSSQALPGRWLLGPAVTSQVAADLPQGLITLGAPAGADDATYLAALTSSSTAVSPTDGAITLFGPTLLSVVLAAPLNAGGGARPSVALAYLTNGDSDAAPVFLPAMLDDSGTTLTLITPSSDAACPAAPAARPDTGSALKVTSAPCPQPVIALVTLQAARDASAAQAAVCATTGLAALSDASTAAQAAGWPNDTSILDASAPADVMRLRRGKAIACPPFCGGADAAGVLAASSTASRRLAPAAHATTSVAAALLAASSWDSAQPAPTAAAMLALAQPSGGCSTCSGFLFVRPCFDLSTLPPGAPPLSVICANGSSPLSAGSAGLCFWGQGPDCVPCPVGGVCPGGYRLWSAPGYYVPSETSLVLPMPCSYPAKARCVGWDAHTGTTACGVGYTPGAPACARCAPGYYANSETAGGSCESCASWVGDSSLAAFSGVAVAIEAVIVVGIILGAVAVIIAVKSGASKLDAIKRTADFVVESFTALQLAATIASATPPSAPPFVAAIFTALRVLQFRGLDAAPPACVSLPPLPRQRAS